MSTQLDERSNIQAPATNHEPAKNLSKNTCLKCNKHHDTLHCTNPGCPIVIHKHCMPCVPRFDDKGNFLCPYCVYKRSVAECRKTKELVLVAKKNLAKFMGTKSVKTTEDLQTDKIHTRDSENLKTKRTSSEQSKVNLKNDAEIQKGQCDDRQTLVRSPIDADFEESSLPKSKEDRHLRERHKMSDEVQETPSKTTGHAEAVNLASDNLQKKYAMNRKHDLAQELLKQKGSRESRNDNEDENISRVHKEVSEKNTDETGEVGDIQKADERGKQIKLQKNDEISTRKGNMEDESKLSQESYHKGYSLRCKRKREISVDSDSSNESKASGEDENISRIQKKINKNNTDETGEKATEREKQVKLQKNDVISTRGRKTGDFDSEEESESSQMSHQKGYSLRCKRKREISVDSDSSNESKKVSGSSESEFEESEELTQVLKSRRKIAHSKQLEQTPISIGRRKKLPWTEEEEDILKEAVDKISLTVKKNMPWTKILEYGSHIFDGTRTPDDLKDKWRRIVNKAHENA